MEEKGRETMKKRMAAIKQVLMKEVPVCRLAFWGLVVAFCASCCINLIQLDQWNSSRELSLAGSYSTQAYGSVYVVFDKYGHYCKYTQQDGLLEEGTYVESGGNQYHLKGNAGESGDILLVKDGVYYTSEDGSLTYAPKFYDIPVFVGNWTLEWEGW